MESLAHLPVTTLIQRILSKEVSAVELLDVFIARQQQFGAAVNAIVASNIDAARKRALDADRDLAKGIIWGPLHGIPFTIKDLMEVEAMPCTAGSPDFQDHMPTKNAALVEHLINAGAIIWGKTNTPALGLDFNCTNEVYGVTNNPWDTSRSPGGSSGGAAAAIAAGLTAIDIGSDMGGSIRLPAHFCGVYGHKPSFDIVPMTGNIPPDPAICLGDHMINIDIVVAGPMAKSADDLALVMDIIAKPIQAKHAAWAFKLPDARKKRLQDYRVGLWMNGSKAYPVDKQVSDRLDQVVTDLQHVGVNIDDKKPDFDLGGCMAVYRKLMHAPLVSGLSDEKLSLLRQQVEEQNPSLNRREFYDATKLLYRDWIGFDYMRSLMQKQWAEYFKDYDVLLCPAAAITAPLHDDTHLFDRTVCINGKTGYAIQSAILPWQSLAGVSHLPATVAPVGLAENGLPVGLQIIGPYLEDKTPMHFASLIAEITGGFVTPENFR